jgi:hypothetical protein
MKAKNTDSATIKKIRSEAQYKKVMDEILTLMNKGEVNLSISQSDQLP